MLDEVGDVSPALQAKLLRVLQQREYEPLGATETVRADVRIIAATNRRLDELVAAGEFREDLFYRLNVLRIDLPPLAERREDLPLLAEHFLRRFAAKQDKHIAAFSEAAMKALLRYHFPGNVRELENIVERAVVLCREGYIPADCLPPEVLDPARHRVAGDPHPAQESEDPLRAAEAQAIREALRQHDGHRRRTAEALGIDKTTLWRKMKRLGVTYP
jgi:transcriptional regulator with PAS, ATPase and Fis domain